MEERFTRITLEGSYTPRDFKDVWSQKDYDVVMNDGSILVEIKNPSGQISRLKRDKIAEEIKTRINTKNLCIDNQIEFKGIGNAVHYREDGKTEFVLYAETGIFSLKGGKANIFCQNANGEIINDTRPDWEKNQQDFERLASKWANDKGFQKIQESLLKAKKNKNHFLYHLYEICDFIIDAYPKKYHEIFGIYKYKDLKNMANGQGFALNEGRHRGKLYIYEHNEKRLAIYRNATSQERDRAFNIARNIIYKYLLCLEQGIEPSFHRFRDTE